MMNDDEHYVLPISLPSLNFPRLSSYQNAIVIADPSSMHDLCCIHSLNLLVVTALAHHESLRSSVDRTPTWAVFGRSWV